MRAIIESCLQFRFLVVVLAAVLMVAGFSAAREMPVDILPEFSPPYVEIQTEALGLSAAEVESLITVPMEQDLLNGVAWLHAIRSESVPGLSSITLIFEPGTDLYRARQMVAERLSQAAVGLPHVSKAPTMLQPTSATSRVMIIGLSSKTMPLIRMSVLARWTIVPRLMGVPGVANVAVWGQRDRQLQVQVDPERLRAHGVSLMQVVETAGNALWVSSLSFVEASTPGNAGFIDTPQQRLGVHHVLPIISPEGLAQVPLVDSPRVRLLDVAKVVEDHQPLIGDALDNSASGLLLVIDKFPGTNTQKVTRGVEDALAAMRPGLGGIEINSNVFRPADFIQMALDNLGRALLIAAVLVLLALALWFFDWRAALVSAVAIALSLSAALLVLYQRGATLNVMAIAGLAMAIGIIVDDAIIGVENVVRRLRLSAAGGRNQPLLHVILEASLEMRSAVFFANLITLLVALPFVALEGVPGAFVQPLVVSYVLSVWASLVVALTVTPVLCAILFYRAPGARLMSPFPERFQHGYERIVARLLAQPRAAYIVVGILLLLALASLPFLRPSLLPAFKEQDLLVRLEAAPATSHPEMVRLINQISGELRTTAGIRSVNAHVGRAIYGDQVVGINAAELWLGVDPAARYDETIAAVQNVVDQYPGIRTVLQGYLNEIGDRVTAQPKDPIVVRVYGQDWTTLRDEAEKMRQTLSGIAGVANAHAVLPVEEPILQVTVDLVAAQRYGLKPGDVRRAAAILVNSLQVGSLFEEQKVFDVVVWSTPETRRSLTGIRDLLIDTPDGRYVRLGDVAQIGVTPAPSAIVHEDVSRFIDVGLGVSGRDVASVLADVRATIGKSRFPLEYHAAVVDNYGGQQAAQNRLLAIGLVVAIGVFLLHQASFGSWRIAGLSIFLLTPATLAGGLLVALASGALSIGALAGLVALLGIAARNGTMLVSHYQHLERHEGEVFGAGLVLRGARERLAPVVMTALTTALAFAPFVFLGDIPGLEILRPMALVVLGGLLVGTLFNLFVTPVLFLRFGVSVPESEALTTPLRDEPVPA